MNTDIKTGTLVFKPRARLIKTIGEELISDDKVAIIELVKNRVKVFSKLDIYYIIIVLGVYYE